ncbi:PspC domain-containing protein [Actinoplanes sp. NPDC051475]|uniref:PspC domain-containing protein n=1 Tax=Actinoplanes sp. NPDC051475 TaxID=3157225 RepID=UPI00344F69A7
MTDPTVAPYRQLRRPLDDRIVAGVCSGIGRYLGLDPVLIRVAFAGLTVLTWGTALIAYPVMWFLMPEEPGPAVPPWRDPADPAWGRPPTYPPATEPAAAPTSTPPAP